MSDFDEMRLVFKVEGGFVWRCPCGLGAKAPVATAGKARTGARDHINRRHPRGGGLAAQPEPGLHPSGMPVQDFQDLVDTGLKRGLRIEVLAPRKFQERVRRGLSGRYAASTYPKLTRHYGFVDQVVVVASDAFVPPAAWMPLVETLEERGYTTLFDVPDWSLPGPKAVLVGATRIPPRARCQAYAAGSRRAGAPEGGPGYRTCPNWVERIVVLTDGGPRSRPVRVGLCKMHHRTHGSAGHDLSMGGGEEFVEFRAGGLPPPPLPGPPPLPPPPSGAADPPEPGPSPPGAPGASP